jgi:hypothetical protein
MSLEINFVAYQIALDMKSIGFDEECLAYYDQWFKGNNEVKQIFRVGNVKGIFDSITPAPTFSQAFKFFRDKHNLRGSIMDFIDEFPSAIEWDYEIALIGTDLDEYGHYKALVSYSIDDESRKFKTYEEAELACLIKLIELVKESKVL